MNPKCIPSDEQTEVLDDPTPLDRMLLDLNEIQLNLLFYLIGSHHGKVRGSLSATPEDHESATSDSQSIPIRGIRDGDRLPDVEFVDGNGRLSTMPALTLHLDPAALGLSIRYGPSWIERIQKLLECYGSFTLAYFEALFRAADIRASKLDTLDPLLTGGAK
jgi:CRISPR-associated endonuclease/helicase Cas3